MKFLVGVYDIILDSRFVEKQNRVGEAIPILIPYKNSIIETIETIENGVRELKQFGLGVINVAKEDIVKVIDSVTKEVFYTFNNKEKYQNVELEKELSIYQINALKEINDVVNEKINEDNVESYIKSTNSISALIKIRETGSSTGSGYYLSKYYPSLHALIAKRLEEITLNVEIPKPTNSENIEVCRKYLQEVYGFIDYRVFDDFNKVIKLINYLVEKKSCGYDLIDALIVLDYPRQYHSDVIESLDSHYKFSKNDYSLFLKKFEGLSNIKQVSNLFHDFIHYLFEKVKSNTDIFLPILKSYWNSFIKLYSEPLYTPLNTMIEVRKLVGDILFDETFIGKDNDVDETTTMDIDAIDIYNSIDKVKLFKYYKQKHNLSDTDAEFLCDLLLSITNPIVNNSITIMRVFKYRNDIGNLPKELQEYVIDLVIRDKDTLDYKPFIYNILNHFEEVSEDKLIAELIQKSIQKNTKEMVAFYHREILDRLLNNNFEKIGLIYRSDIFSNIPKLYYEYIKDTEIVTSFLFPNYIRHLGGELNRLEMLLKIFTVHYKIPYDKIHKGMLTVLYGKSGISKSDYLDYLKEINFFNLIINEDFETIQNLNAIDKIVIYMFLVGERKITTKMDMKELMDSIYDVNSSLYLDLVTISYRLGYQSNRIVVL